MGVKAASAGAPYFAPVDDISAGFTPLFGHPERSE
jgi:hypothetical protein